jgi:hypothetical protein
MSEFKVKTIIDKAFELIGVKSTDAALPAYQETDGIDMLNDRLADYSNSPSKVPYGKELSFNTVANQEDYEIGVGKSINEQRIVRIPYVNIKTPGTIIEPLIMIDRESWYNNPRSTVNVGLPQWYYFDQQLDFSRIRFRPIPNAVYEIIIWAKFEIPTIGLLDDLSVYLPKNWREFVKYDLANSLFSMYPTEFWDEDKKKKYSMLKKSIESGSDNTIYPSYNGILTASNLYRRYYNGKRFF